MSGAHCSGHDLSGELSESHGINKGTGVEYPEQARALTSESYIVCICCTGWDNRRLVLVLRTKFERVLGKGPRAHVWAGCVRLFHNTSGGSLGGLSGNVRLQVHYSQHYYCICFQVRTIDREETHIPHHLRACQVRSWGSTTIMEREGANELIAGTACLAVLFATQFSCQHSA